MAIAPKPDLKSLMADKPALQRLLDEQDRQTGFVPDPAATLERLREMMLSRVISTIGVPNTKLSAMKAR